MLMATIVLPCKSELRVVLCGFAAQSFMVLFFMFSFFSITGSAVTGRFETCFSNWLLVVRLVTYLTCYKSE